jgi:5'-methylthioadenosine phosphorylase
MMLAVIGGSGVYNIEGLERKKWTRLRSSFGTPSDAALVGVLEGVKVAFLPRHGRGHRVPPSAINYRANIEALKRLGVTDIISVSAVGSLREHLAPGMFVIVDQFIDRTFAREKSFFGPGLVAHVSMARPVCARLGAHLHAAATEAGISVARGGTYLVMEGPQFSSYAESELYRTWNCDVIGMTNMPEAKLAREAEMCYATVAMVTDYDCWHPHHDDVTVEAVVKVLVENADRARALVRRAAPRIAADKAAAGCSCRSALEHALITAPDVRDPKVAKRLAAVAGRVLKKGKTA